MEPSRPESTQRLGPEAPLSRPSPHGPSGFSRRFSTISEKGLHLAATSGRLTLVGLVLLVAQSVLWVDAPVLMKLGCATVAVLAYTRPADALLVVAGLTPLGVVIARLWHAAPVRFAEALVVAFLAGWLLKATHFGMRRFPVPARFMMPLTLFGAVVIASTFEQLAVYQVWQDHPWSYAKGFWFFLTRHYFTDVTGYWHVPVAALLLEGVALFVAVVAIGTHDDGLSRRLARMIVAGAVGAAVLTLPPVALNVMTSAVPGESFRLSHIGDVNSAASYFALAAPIAFITAAAWNRWNVIRFMSGAVIVGALWSTRSRTALIAIGLIVGVELIRFILRRLKSRSFRKALVAAILIAASTLVLSFRNSPDRFLSPAAQTSLSFRAQFLETGLSMFASRPMFGVGIGQYYLFSGLFSPPELRPYYPRENAHNNFLQILAELGPAGLVSFLWLIGTTLLRSRAGFRAHSRGSPTWGTFVGLIAFLLTCLGGHPLLVREVAYAFWAVLGLAALLGGASAKSLGSAQPGHTSDPQNYSRRSRPDNTDAEYRRRVFAVVAILCLTISIPARVHREVDEIDLTDVTYGFHDWETDSNGTRFRWSTERSTFFVGPDARDLEIPLRALFHSEHENFEVDVLMDGRLVEQIRLADGEWHRIRLSLPRDIHDGFRQFELRIAPTWIPAKVLDGSSDARELGVQVGEIEVVVFSEPPP